VATPILFFPLIKRQEFLVSPYLPDRYAHHEYGGRSPRRRTRATLVMSASDTITLTIPKRPAFSVGRLVAVEAQSSNQKVCSVNELTISVLSP